MRSPVFLLMLAMCLVALSCGADADGVDSGLSADNLQAGAGTLTTTKAPVAPVALAPVPISPLPAASEPEGVITTSTAASSSSSTPPQQAPPEQGQPQGQPQTPNQGVKQNERENTPIEQNNPNVLATTTTKAATPPADVGTLTDNTDHSSQRQQIPAPLQTPTTITAEVSPAQQQTPTPSKGADAGGEADKGKQQAKTSTPVADDMATQTVPTNSDKKINVAQTSVTSTSVPTKGESTSPTTLLPNLSNAMQHVDKKDNTIGSSSLFALAALATVVIMTVSPAY